MQMCLQEERVIKERLWPIGLVGKYGGMSKPGPMLKFKRLLDLIGIGNGRRNTGRKFIL
jgi:hypothetical protein